MSTQHDKHYAEKLVAEVRSCWRASYKDLVSQLLKK